MPHNKLFKTVDQLYEKYLTVWEEFCNIESPTNCKEGVDACGKYMSDKARELGFAVETLNQPFSGNVVCITLNPENSEAPLSISGHMDTVHPVGSFGIPAVHHDNNKIYGPGVTDCKGGIVTGMLALEALKVCGYNKRPVKLLLQSDE